MADDEFFDALIDSDTIIAGPISEDAEYLVKWIRRHALTSFSKRDSHQHCKARFRTVDELSKALEELALRNMIRVVKEEQTQRGRPPSPSYQVNPNLLNNTEVPF
jgi:hypothetical protein